MWGNCLLTKRTKKVYLTVSECHERLPLQVGLLPLCMSEHKPLVITVSIPKAVIIVIVSAKCLFSSRAALHYLKQCLLCVRSEQEELKPKKKTF